MKKLIFAALLALLPATAQAGIFYDRDVHVDSMTLKISGAVHVASDTSTASTPTITLDGKNAKITATVLDLNGADVGPELASVSVATQANAAAIAAIQVSSLPPTGSVTMYASSVVPAGWYECDGSTRSRTIDAALFGVVGTTFGIGDGATTFHLPDLRGMFVRGWDHGAGTDPEAGARVASSSGTATGDNVGSFQDDDFESHSHSGSAAGGGGFFSQVTAVIANGQSGLTGGAETRPKNIYLMYIIKN